MIKHKMIKNLGVFFKYHIGFFCKNVKAWFHVSEMIFCVC